MPTIIMAMLPALNRLNADVAASFGQVNSVKPSRVRPAFKAEIP